VGEQTRSIVLDAYVRGASLDESHFSVTTTPLAAITDGQVLLETITLSVDPYLRSCMTGHDNFFLPQFALGTPLYSAGVARVVDSRLSGYRAGDIVVGTIDWSDYSFWSPSGRMIGGGAALQPVDPRIRKLSHALGAVGLNGVTAFFGVLAVARPRRGETMVVSGAAGGVGSLAGQIAKIQGARVIGLAGSQQKRDLLVDELGFDAALDYRSALLADELESLVPGGPDVYFDNVGGAVSQTVMSSMRHPARVIECGQISTYDDDDGGWKVDIRPIHGGSLRLQSFTPVPFLEFEPAARAQLAHWIDQGKLIALETEHDGLESAPHALVGLFRGGNVGKAIVNVAKSPF
jgi:NADPH-dependent curcumin reductase CurA